MHVDSHTKHSDVDTYYKTHTDMHAETHKTHSQKHLFSPHTHALKYTRDTNDSTGA